MAKLVAMIDFYSPLWDSQEMKKVFEFGTDEDKRDFLLNHGKLESPEDVDEDEIHDEEIVRGGEFVIYYDDWGMLESVKLVEL